MKVYHVKTELTELKIEFFIHQR